MANKGDKRHAQNSITKCLKIYAGNYGRIDTSGHRKTAEEELNL